MNMMMTIIVLIKINEIDNFLIVIASLRRGNKACVVATDKWLGDRILYTENNSCVSEISINSTNYCVKRVLWVDFWAVVEPIGTR